MDTKAATKIPTRKAAPKAPAPEVKDSGADTTAPGVGTEQGSPAGGEATENGVQAGVQADAGQNTEGAKDKVSEDRSAALTDEVYAEAAEDIAAGKKTLDFCVNGMSTHFGVPAAVVRDVLEKRVKAVVHAAHEKMSSDKAAAAKEEIAVFVPKPFQLWIGGGYKLIKAGAQRMTREHAESDYAKANGVKAV